ncbi:hypothetical protein E5288_WYG001001 [Bos mutus]|uniref:Uncharacterized protein n=1 Tax=Bos mutus TaxID=72004 RepID=A0A6B0RX26_9CETA|nr:hypothetical protein [Bos mutus]
MKTWMRQWEQTATVTLAGLQRLGATTGWGQSLRQRVLGGLEFGDETLVFLLNDIDEDFGFRQGLKIAGDEENDSLFNRLDPCTRDTKMKTVLQDSEQQMNNNTWML